MKAFIFSILSTVVLFSCSQKIRDKSEQIKQIIIKTDLSTSELAVKEGFFAALTQYAADDFVKLNDGEHPVIGKREFEELYKDKPGTKSLTWQPVKADVSESGDLGYTWGNWKMALPDTTLYGNYFTVWKKQEDGKWKMALDGGNTAPAPK